MLNHHFASGIHSLTRHWLFKIFSQRILQKKLSQIITGVLDDPIFGWFLQLPRNFLGWVLILALMIFPKSPAVLQRMNASYWTCYRL
jgi:hypothetical protein